MNDLNMMPSFEQSLGAINAQKQKQDDESDSFQDPRFITFRAGNTYRVRLCWPVDPNGKRIVPFIFKTIHGDFRENGTKTEVVCPTSDYISGKSGFKQCPCCKEVGDFYKDAKENKNKTSEELYKNFKRQFRNVALVYVVSDSLTVENNGSFKLMRVPHKVANFLRRKIYGWAISNDEPQLTPEQIVGKDAFLFDSGFDLMISVSKERTDAGEFNQYTPEFLPKPTAIPNVTQAHANKAAIDLKFDEDFYKMSSVDEIKKFVSDAVLKCKLSIELDATYDPSKNQQKQAQHDPIQQMNPNNPPPNNQAQNMAVNNVVNNVVNNATATNNTTPAQPTEMAQPKASGQSQSVDDILASLGLNQ